jgi:hypothetical protein
MRAYWGAGAVRAARAARTDGQFCYRFEARPIDAETARLRVDMYERADFLETPRVALSIGLLLSARLEARLEAGEAAMAARAARAEEAGEAERMLFLACRAAREHLRASDGAWRVRFDAVRSDVVRSALARDEPMDPNDRNDIESPEGAEGPQGHRDELGHVRSFCKAAATMRYADGPERLGRPASLSTLVALRADAWTRDVRGLLASSAELASRDEFFAYFEGLVMAREGETREEREREERERARATARWLARWWRRDRASRSSAARRTRRSATTSPLRSSCTVAPRCAARCGATRAGGRSCSRATCSRAAT